MGCIAKIREKHKFERGDTENFIKEGIEKHIFMNRYKSFSVILIECPKCLTLCKIGRQYCNRSKDNAVL